MRYKGTTPSSKDTQINVYNFTLGKSEVILLRDLLQDAKKRTPDSIFTMPMRGRVQNMIKCLNDLMFSENFQIAPKSKNKIHLRDVLTEDADGVLA